VQGLGWRHDRDARSVRGLRVAEPAEAAGVTRDTVRYYERVRLLPPPRRTPAGYRAYDAAAVDRLKFIHGAQRLGLRLRDIGDLLAVRDTGACPCEPAEQLLEPLGVHRQDMRGEDACMN
jgi:DNA-binding transcriptional MerR regulator